MIWARSRLPAEPGQTGWAGAKRLRYHTSIKLENDEAAGTGGRRVKIAYNKIRKILWFAAAKGGVAGRGSGMAVITVSRGSFSGGKRFSECVASLLGYRCIDRDAIVEQVAARGVSPNELLDALLKPPGLLERFNHRRYTYLALIQAALAEEVRAGKAVYHGNAGHLLLQGGGPILRIRIIVPEESRIATAAEQLKLSRREATARIRRADQQRRKWTQYLYGVDWGDPALYDVILNLERVGIEQTCGVIANMARSRCFEFTAECQAWMDNLALASRVRANLATDPATSHLEFEVTADGGRVSVRGRLAGPDEQEAVAGIAKSTPGVEEVNVDRPAAGTSG